MMGRYGLMLIADIYHKAQCREALLMGNLCMWHELSSKEECILVKSGDMLVCSLMMESNSTCLSTRS